MIVKLSLMTCSFTNWKAKVIQTCDGVWRIYDLIYECGDHHLMNILVIRCNFYRFYYR